MTRTPAAYSAAGWRNALHDPPPGNVCVWLLGDGWPQPIAAIPGALRPDLDRARLWRQPRMARLTCAARLPSRSRFPRRALQKALRDYDRGPPPDPF